MHRNSIRARMTLAFDLSTALLMFLACGALALYARRAAEQNAQTLLQATSRKIYDDLTDDEHKVALSEIVEEEQETLRPNNMALLVADAQGHIVMKSGQNVPAWPRTQQEDWRVTTLSFDSHTIVIRLPCPATY